MLGLDYCDAARQGIEDFALQNAHPFVFFEAGSEGTIALFELNAELGHFFMQLAIGVLQSTSGGNESGKGVG